MSQSNSERARAWRERQRANGKRSSGKSGKSAAKPSLFESGEFVAIDGEGFSEGPERTFTVETSGAQYRGREHFYALLAASDGSEIYNPDGRLSTAQCLDFLCDITRLNPKAIVVCFGGSYDICQMLCHDLTKDEVIELQSPKGLSGAKSGMTRQSLDISFGQYDYRLEYRPRKSFTVWRWSAGSPKYDIAYKPDGEPFYKLSKCDRVTVWDVWGFFQDSFAGVMRKWIPNDPDYEFIAREKGNRNIFERSEIETIRRYNQAELRCLVAIMEKVRTAIKGLDLKITRWDGAGAIAAAMMKHHDVKFHKSQSPPAVFDAARHAYSGGHIEVPRVGYHNGDIHHYDITSAYPAWFCQLPSLHAGQWIHGTGTPPAGFTVIKTEYYFHEGNSFYPLFFREEDGSIFYPHRGSGWYWYPEYEAAREYAARFGARVFDAVEWWHFKPQTNERPFAWVETYFQARQDYITDAKRRGVDSGEEKIIKLGLNSLYGKTAQQVGARIVDDEVKPPAFFQLEWAGFVTAGCRAQLMQAAIQNAPAIISFATDGLFSTEPLDLETPEMKVLGTWEYQKHDGITMVMPGVYWLHHDGQKPKHYSRGFDKAQMSDAEFIHRAWRLKLDHVSLDITRLIGLGSACASDTFWAMRGMFVTAHRTLALDGTNSKRYPVMLYRERPHNGLVSTVPRDHFDDLLTPLQSLQSRPYDIAWMDPTYVDPFAPDAENERIDDAESEDAENA